ncbi:MAG: hypothetical protein COW00_01750 [Bdellovibrio sp. CG12_big_fil_rev_8_21_14_0_65_39_13]|nr:MAG: hypothetical protein COW78_03500 [Bdellovibrio sp. CG22_combo_CG10-13_8_21_14_all_39_27]PIQ62434.1 MAG: hypothetical protein COW00_01750 [Bdellovibrio sp. CG12_big_fil_rev_8_21_14_0_65_39_13]PIR34101.1 MAG: hypothetical protein COV37_14230 [Bdellovibrio sp. CG11_big_fil_rev_8_21_14_0_20_39_38]
MKSFILGLLCLLPQFLFASSFSIPPYTLQTPDQSVILKFQLKASQELILEQNIGRKSRILFDGPMSAEKLETLTSEPIQCDQTFKLELKEKITDKILYQKVLNGSPCLGSKVNRPLYFGFISDTQQYNDRHLSIAQVIEKKIQEKDVQFILNTGDIVQEGDQDNEWKQFLSTGNIYMGKVPLIAAIGNHDYRGTKGKNVIPKLFKKYLRWNQSDDQGDMVLDFESFRLMVFNSNYFKIKRKEEKKQLQWMINQFEEARRLKKPMIVSMHYPIFSSSMNRFTSGSVRKMRRRLEPLLREYGIKLVLSGHTHMYERSFKDGVHYVVAGPAGGRVNDPSYKNKYKVYMNPDILTYTEFKVFDGLIEMKTWNEKNELVDKVLIDLNS